MRRKYLVTFLGYAVVLVLRSVVAEECSQDISNENCSLTTQNNEIEALSTPHTQEITTHIPEPMTTINMNRISEDSSETVIGLSSTIPNTTTEASSPNTTVEVSSPIPNTTMEASTLVPNTTMEASSQIPNTTMEVSSPIPNTTTEASSPIPNTTTEASTSNSVEVTTLNLADTTPANSSETSTLSLTQNSISNSIEDTTLNSSETSTSSLIHNATALDSTETPASSVEITTMNSSESSTSAVFPNLLESPSHPVPVETSTTFSSETSTPNLTGTSTSSLPDTTSRLLETSEVIVTSTLPNASEASTSRLFEKSTETSIDKSADPSTETTTDLLTTENSTDNPTENAVRDEITTVTTTYAADEPKGRALNFSVEEEHPSNVLSNMSHHHEEDIDLSDGATHENDDEEDDLDKLDVDSLDAKILAPKNQIHNSSLMACQKGGLTYENGEKLELGCESICTCRNGKMDCTDRCVGPYFRRGKKIIDPLCNEKEAEDPCCSILVCAGDTETEPLEMCSLENKTYNRGDTFNKGCTEVCTCEVAGKITCKPRCAPVTKTSDRCVEVPDPDDFCCLKVLCDVTLDEHEPEKEEEKGKPKLLSARYINTTSILLTFDSNSKLDEDNLPIVEVSNDKDVWKYYKLLPGGVVFVKNRIKYLRIENTNDIVEVEDPELGPPLENEYDTTSESDLDLQHGLHPSVETTSDAINCHYKGRIFKEGEEYNDECNSLCMCKHGEMNCLKIQCPTYFGVDVLDPACIEWETVPKDFVPSPPNCCPQKVQCKNNGSCEYEGNIYKNWDPLPSNVTGCEKKCYCEMGKVECQNICPPVTALPPPNLQCPPSLAVVSHIPDDDCCKYWVCNTDTHNSEVLHNHAESDKGQTPKTPTDDYMGPFASKAPSKVLGPLAVYGNEDNEQTEASNSVGVPHKPKISPYENPFYHKKQSPHNPHKPSYPKPSLPKDKLTDQTDAPYLGPFNPPANKMHSKPSKDTQNKVGNDKDNSVFVTPPPHTIIGSYKDHENFVPNYYNPPDIVLDHAPSHINIHSHQSPEEILQFIHQHPEISNYPSGSVLEVHNAVPGSHFDQFGSEGLQSVNRPKIHLVPYLVPHNTEGNTNLPPGFSLEQILEVFQNNSKGLQTNPLDFFQTAQTHPMNGPLVNPPLLNGLLTPDKHNTVTNPGHDGQILPESYPGLPAQHPPEEIVIQSLEAVDPHKVRLSFSVPSVIVGLHGRFEVRYTHNKDEKDLDSWMLTVFAPPNDLIATSSLEFDLTDLKTDTEYSIKITVTLRDLHNMPTSKVYKIRTPKEVHPPVIPIDPELAITDINATWVTVVWRAFTQYELQFIDGIQLRYKEIDGRIYTATPLIHRAVTRYTLEKLKPNTKYEIGIYFIPFPGQMTELKAENMLHFTTANEIDTYGFNVTLEISQIKSQSVEISWSGVPYPEDKYVNIYRAIYQSDSGKEDHSTFKIAKRDSPTKTIIRDLKPGTRYRLWLEVYLTNGKTKTSNVEDFITKPRAAPALGSTQQDKLSRAEILDTKGDYYGPLVIVAILAAIAILSTLILLLILVRRHNQNKAAITPPSTRISQSAYDNPTYKVEIQQETMGL